MLPIAMLILDAYPLRRLGPWARLCSGEAPDSSRSRSRAVQSRLRRGRPARASRHWRSTGQVRASQWPRTASGIDAAAFVLPWGLAPYHEPPVHVDLLAPRFLGAALGGLLVTAAVVALRRRWPAGLARGRLCALLALVSGWCTRATPRRRSIRLPSDRHLRDTAGRRRHRGPGAGHATPTRRRAGAILLCGIVVVLVGWGAVGGPQRQLARSARGVAGVRLPRTHSAGLCAVSLAVEHFNVGQLVDAELGARRGIERWPGRGTPHHRLGAGLLAQGRDAEAETELREAIRLAPGLLRATASWGRLHARQGRFSEATGELRKALALGASVTEVEGLLWSGSPDGDEGVVP